MNTDDIRCKNMEEELGTFWPQWNVVKWLGGGAFGDVFEIVRDNHGVRIHAALKVLRTNNRETDYSIPQENDGPDNVRENRKSGSNSGEEDIPEVFMNEIRIMEALRGAPNIVSIDDFYFRKGTDTSSLYVRMERLTSFVDVMSAHQRNGTQFTIAEVLKIGKDICTALTYCEQRNIIHRDIKPANLFVDKFGDYKVGDFGASKRMETINPTNTMTGIGTISYMAPEIFAGRSYNNTVDIYALGLVLYQLLNNGRIAFMPAYGQNTSQEIDAANYRRLQGEALPPLVGIRVCGDTISSRLDGVIRRACDPDSSRRYRTAKEFHDALSGQEAEPDNTEVISKTERVQERGPREPYKRSSQVNNPGVAGYAENKNVYAQRKVGIRGGEIQQTRVPKHINPAFFTIPIVLIVLVVLVTIWLRSTTSSEIFNNPVSLGCNHSAVIDEDGSLWVWGFNSSGQLGDGSTEYHNEPVKIMDGVKSVSLGEYHSAAIKKDGSLWMWGGNMYGQLGDDSTDDCHEPEKIMNGVQSVSLGYNHSAAIKKDGSLWVWGWNKDGQLGDGSTEERYEPVKIMDGVKSVSLGKNHSAAIKKDDSLWMWGENWYGQLGDGSTEDQHEPVKILDDVQFVSLGERHSAVVKKDGSLWAWGYGSADGPEKISDDVQSVSIGDDFFAAIKTDGSLWTWGYNGHGQLGDGSTQSRSEAIKIMEDVQSVSLGEQHSAAIKTDGSLWLWGENWYGKLGDGSTEDRHEPVKIMDGVASVSKGK